LLFAAVVTVLIVIVAAGTGAVSPRSPAAAPGEARLVVDVAIVILAVTALAGLAGLVASFFPGGRRRRVEPKNENADESLPAPWWVKLLLLGLPVVMLALLTWLLVARPWSTDEVVSPSSRSSVTAGTAVPGSAGNQSRTGPRVDWWLLPAVLAAVVVVAVATTVADRAVRTGRQPHRPAIGTDERDLANAVDTSIDALERDPDCRRAVIGAYARMESWLSASGVPRAMSETPFEYLDRVLVEFGASAVIARTLTELFERAKFAPHPVDFSMKRAALEALTSLRRRLDAVV
jgi:hypothetical protein